MRKYAAFEIQNEVYEQNMRELSEEEVEGTRLEENGTLTTEQSRTEGVMQDKRRVPHVGVQVDGKPREGFPTRTGKLEIWSHDGRVGLARVRHARLHKEPRPPG